MKFFNLRVDVPASVLEYIHGKKFDVTGKGVTVEMECLDMQQNKMTIHSLPSTFTA